jgi:DNA-binding transcriptional LysR family regulator
MSDGFGAIPIFVAVIEHGGFTNAAQVLGVSKSAVSKRIRQLEQHLGVKLLQRTTRKISLTEAGEHYFAHAKLAHSAAKDAEDAVTQLQGEPQGRLRINAPMSFGRLHLAPLIPKFLGLYPKINLDLVMDDKQIDLVSGGFDVAIRAGILPDSNLIARQLTPLHSVICASPSYIEKNGAPSMPHDLKHHNCLLYSYSSQLNSWTFKDQHQSCTVEINGNYQVNNSEALKEALLQGLGIARLPTFVAGPYIESGALIHLLPNYDMPKIAIYALFLERQYMPAKVRAFIDFSIKHLGGTTPYWDAQVWPQSKREHP